MNTEELDVLFPQPRTLRVRRADAQPEDLLVRPLTVAQIPPILRLVGNEIWPLLHEAMLAEGETIDLEYVVAQGGEQLIEAVAIAVGRDAGWAGTLYPDAFIELLSLVLEVNADFFFQRMLPRLKMLREELAARAKAQAGSTTSPSSSTTDTPRPG